MIVRTSPRSLRRAAFTLLEMMIVVAIIVAIAGVSATFYFSQADEGNRTKAAQEMSQIRAMAVRYKLAKGQVPGSPGVINDWKGGEVVPPQSPWRTDYSISGSDTLQDPILIHCTDNAGKTFTLSPKGMNDPYSN